MPAAEIRRRFVEFFAERGHAVVPSASLVPAGDPTLLFTNSGMVQFKDVLTGAETRSYTRAVDYQRCLRVAGKHNDFEEVGRTPRHHTFFEMLGNWSFGDYFKREAIHCAWDFLTRDLGIPADRLAATTYKDDEVAWAIWRDEIGLPPERMARWGDVDDGDDSNFWRMADTGPCGPCSEIHFDRGAHFSEGPECIPDHCETCPRWLEIWNLVFMEFDQRPDGRVPLPFTSVDTGMGLERLASVLQQVPTNYDTDLFTPIHARMRELLGHDPDAFETERFSYQVIADHSRAVTFLIADGVLPSNEGRGYVLRRIVRRAVRHGRLLGRREPFLAEAAEVVIDVMGEAYPHLVERRDEILGAIAREEAQFARTLDAGTDLLETRSLSASLTMAAARVIGRQAEDLPADAPVLPGDDRVQAPRHVRLPDRPDRRAGGRVRRRGRSRRLRRAPSPSSAIGAARGNEGRAREARRARGALRRDPGRVGDSRFLGYETTTAEGRVVAILRDGIEYDELTGHGEARGRARSDPVLRRGWRPGRRSRRPARARRRERAVQVDRHAATGRRADRPSRDAPRPAGGRRDGRGRRRRGRRADTMRNHTGTHLLHRALRNVVGERARQAGSLVTPDDLRFDFPFDRGLTDDEKRAIEDEVRRVIREDRPVTVAFLSMAEAIEGGADAFFDEKYGETVRTIRVEGYSFELCGGTHCRASGQIGGFVITGERSIGSGMRRIEALTGGGADALVRERVAALETAADALGAQSVDAIGGRIGALQDELRETKRRLRAGAGAGLPKPGELAATAVEVAPGCRLVAAGGPFESMDALKAAARGPPRRPRVRRDRARPRRRRAAGLRDRLGRPRRREGSRRATS